MTINTRKENVKIKLLWGMHGSSGGSEKASWSK